ncbi:TetR/AcrR family transcriptional regulator [Roseomonas rosulenta]|uniref:TetR/AcrR family transcriptional regulator n=1 Tax=Roseomonas rosulenta TaxID=2748667 RepID=UPI0018DF72F6|nr:helix-turn-helix domain-containing protein [Roseomonas rosulenta]
MNRSFTKDQPTAIRRGPRPAPGRLAAIAEAAARVFTRQGFRLSQVADVAREAGVAAGTVYLYAADKAALLDLAIRVAGGLRLPAGDGPVRADLDAVLAEALGPRLALPRMQAVAAGDPDCAATLRDIAGELYDLLAREARLILLLDRLGAEVPEISAAYGTRLRARALKDFTRAIRQLAIRGDVRTDLEPELAARAVLEMIAWMAMRRPGNSTPPAGDEALARETTIRLAEAALTPDRRPPSRIGR